MSIRVFSTPDMISEITFWRGVGFGLSFSFFRYGMSSSFTNFLNAFVLDSSSSLRLFGFAFGDSSGAAQSFQR